MFSKEQCILSVSLDYLNKIEGTDNFKKIIDIFQKIYIQPDDLLWDHGQLIQFFENNVLTILSSLLYGSPHKSKIIVSPKEQHDILISFLENRSNVKLEQLEQETKPQVISMLLDKTVLFSFTDFLNRNQLFPKDLSIQKNDLLTLFEYFSDIVHHFDTEWLESISTNNKVRLLTYSLLTRDYDMFLELKSQNNGLFIKNENLYFDKGEKPYQGFLLANGFKGYLERTYHDEKNMYFIGQYRLPGLQLNDFLKNKVCLVLKKGSGKEVKYEFDYFYRRDLKNYYIDENGYVGLKAKIPLETLKTGEYKFFIRIYSVDKKKQYIEEPFNATTLFNRFKGYKRIDNKYYLIAVSKKNKISLKVKGKQSKLSMLLRKGVTHMNKVRTNLRINRAIAVDRLLYLLTYPIYHGKDIWLISERGDTCQDNSYHLFKYIRKNYPRKRIYYILDMDSKDYDKIKSYKNVIDKDSKKHRILLLHSKILLNSYDVESYNTPTYYSKSLFLKSFGDVVNYKTVFLQHGISYNDPSSSISKNRIGNNLIITSLPKETEFIIENMNYTSDEVKLTGFPRYDNLKYRDKVKREILLMPTWRRNIVPKSYLTNAVHDEAELEKKFVSSEYYKFYNNLLNSAELSELIDKYDITFKFYPHYEVQPFLDTFNVGNDKIQILGKNSGDVQDLLISADLLITDYSSVFFDFAVMKKPIVFCHFDYEDFYKTQYKKGVFDLKTLDFGYISENLQETIENIEKVIKNNFEMEPEHKKSVDDVFYYDLDGKYCERVYEAINDLSKKK